MTALQKGFTLLEILLVIGVTGILVTIIFSIVNSARDKAVDGKIRSNVRQVRILAEVAYSAQGFTYLNWSSNITIQDDLSTLQTDLQDIGVPAGDLKIGDSDATTFCISAPLRSDDTQHYCTDTTGQPRTVSGPCPTATPHVCPSS